MENVENKENIENREKPNLNAMKKLRDDFQNLFEKVSQTKDEVKGFLGDKCKDLGKRVEILKKAYLNKDNAKVFAKLVLITTTIVAMGTAVTQYNAAQKTSYKIYENNNNTAQVQEIGDVELNRGYNIKLVGIEQNEEVGIEDVLDSIDDIEDGMKVMSGMMDAFDNMGDNLQCMEALARKLKQIAKAKEAKKDIEEDKNTKLSHSYRNYNENNTKSEYGIYTKYDQRRSRVKYDNEKGQISFYRGGKYVFVAEKDTIANKQKDKGAEEVER